MGIPDLICISPEVSWVALLLCIFEALGSDLSLMTGYHD
jgi:hypothetical protein